MARLLDRLTLGNSTGTPFIRLWDRVCTQIEDLFASQQDQIDDITALQTAQATLISDLAAAVADITAAQAAADAAAADAATAQTTADAVTLSDKIGGSSVIPAEVLSASDAGTDATITIAAHARLYNDGSTLSGIGGGSLTGLSYSTTYNVYYDDPTASTTTPSYQATDTLSNALNNFIAGRHFVGTVTTPASGGTATSGGYTPPATDPADRNKYSTL